jgi:hypothetical protein
MGKEMSGAPGESRTPDLLVRSQRTDYIQSLIAINKCFYL